MEVSGRKKPYKPKKEFAKKMRAGPPTSALPKPVPFGGGWLCFYGVSGDVMWYDVMWLVAR